MCTARGGVKSKVQNKCAGLLGWQEKCAQCSQSPMQYVVRVLSTEQQALYATPYHPRLIVNVPVKMDKLVKLCFLDLIPRL